MRNPNNVLRGIRHKPIVLSGMRRFVAKKTLKEGDSRIGTVGRTFRKNLLGVVERGVSPCRVKRFELMTHGSEGNFLEAFHGDFSDKTLRLCYIFEFLRTTSRFKRYMFFVRKKGIIWVVIAPWYSTKHGWHLGAIPITASAKVRAGYEVVCPV